MKRTAHIATVVLALVSIGGVPSMANPSGQQALDDSAWVLTSLFGAAVATKPTARFETGRVFGTDGCNRYSAPFKSTGTAITIGPHVTSTEMACGEGVMRQAAAFVSALTGAKSYRLHEGQLQLLDATGAVLASFAAQAQSLAGTSWRATNINNGRQAVVSLVADTTVTMNFAADGKVSGSGGCNNYTSSYVAEGNRLRFTPAAATRRMCATPGVMEQEQAFFSALATVATMRIEGERLEMRTTDDALALMLVSNPPR